MMPESAAIAAGVHIESQQIGADWVVNTNDLLDRRIQQYQNRRRR